MIYIENLYKEYGSGKNVIKALKDINIHIEKKDIYGIIGLSGAGKSTLVRCMNRLEEPSMGRVIVDGTDLTALTKKELREKRKKIGMIFQHFNLLSSRTVAENIAYPLEIAGKKKDEIQKKITELLELVELEDKANAYPSQLSGGQKQRVGIARALANDPDVLLCDEATSALDPKTTNSILNLLKGINEKLDLTIVIITHEMEVIKEICNKVAVMEQGEVIEQGTITEVFAYPKHPTTQKFVQAVPHEIPSELEITGVEEQELIRLSFVGTATKKPILSHMLKKYDVEANILLGSVDNLKNTIVGNLIVQLIGEGDEIHKAIGYLRENEVECEVIKKND